MKKINLLIYLTLILMLVLSACSSGGKQSTEQHESNKHPYHRIISLMPSNTEILYELGLGKKIVGVSTVDDYPKQVKDKKKFNAMKLNKEALLKAKPDLILAHESQKSTAGDVLKSLKKSGIKVVYIKDAQSIDETYDTFKQIGKITGKEKVANDLVRETKHNVEKVKSSIPNSQKSQQVFMEISSQPEIYTAGKHTFFNDMLKQLKVKNSFAGLEGWPKVSKEDIIKKNPDIMIATSGISQKAYQKEVKGRGGFNQVKAVKNNRIKAVDGDKISRPGPRIDDGLKVLEKAIYEEKTN